MKKRRPFTSSLSEDLLEDVTHLQAQLDALPPGLERDQILKRIRQNETASHIDEWLKSPGLQPPTDVTNLVK